MSESLKKLENRLNYKFNDLEKLKSALTHRSVRANNNERLEFLGDSIVNFVIAFALYQKFPRAKEGELSRLRATLVKGEAMAELAQEFCLGDYLILGVGELRSGGAKRESILADAMEAVIGAIYLDANFEICQQTVLAWYQSRLDNLEKGMQLKDPKTLLQEYLQARKIALPDYQVMAVEGESHSQQFRILCSVSALNMLTEGMGTSRRKAERRRNS